MSFKSYEGRYYIESKNIRVFPCAYRGYYSTTGEETTTKVFDPEARATTEANFANTYHKISTRKESYVVSWDSENSVLKVVIGGYYFEITGHTINDFFDEDNPKSLCIKTEEITLGTDDADTERKTTILKSWTENDKYLDVADSSGTTYIFTGLIVVNNLEDADVENANNILTPFILKDNIKIVNPAAYTANYILDTDTGKNSIRLVDDFIDEIDMSTKATGDYAVALGKHTEAIGNYALAFGNEAVASGESSVAFGEKATAQSKGSFAFGEYVTTDADNQVVIGKYNKADTNQAFIIGNGTAKNNSNKFTVSYQGDINTAGTLTVADNKATILGGNLRVKNNTILDGTVSIKGKATSAKTKSTDKDDVLVTKSYIDDLLNVSQSELEAKIKQAQQNAEAAAEKALNDKVAQTQSVLESKIQDAETAAKEAAADALNNKFKETNASNTIQAGHYIVSVTQDNGKITPTSKAFAKVITATGDDAAIAPTSAAVYTAINKIWENTELYKNVIDVIYPIGSIYTYSSTKLDESCPIKHGNWKRIDPGTFLCACDPKDGATRYYPGDARGSADAIVVKHTHAYSTDTISGGGHEHKIKLPITKLGQDDYTGVNGNAGNTVKDYLYPETTDEPAGTHQHTLPAILNSGEAGTGKNLPPYLAVYMWIRTA